MMNDVATEPRRTLGRRLIGGLGRGLAWAIAALTVLIGLAFFGGSIPLGPAEDAVSTVAMLVPWLTGTLIVFGLIGIATAAYAWRTRRRALATAGALAGIAASLMCAVPWGTASRDADVSWGEYFAAVPQATPDATETYTTVDGQDLQVDVYEPAGASGPAPAIIYVHGGGWSGGSRSESAPWQQWLSDQGYAVFSIDYRLASPPRWQDAVGDVKCALGWVRANAATFGADPAAVSLVGDSAGGHLSLMAAYTVGDPAFTPSCAVEEAPVSSVSAWFAPTDLTALAADSDMPASAEGYLTAFLGASLDEEPGRYETASPLTHVDSEAPATMIVQGGVDRLVSLDQGAALAQALKAADVPVTELDLAWSHHGFTGQWGSWGSQALRPAALEFLGEYAG